MNTIVRSEQPYHLCTFFLNYQEVKFPKVERKRNALTDWQEMMENKEQAKAILSVDKSAPKTSTRAVPPADLRSSATAQRQPVKDAEQPSHDVSKNAAKVSTGSQCDSASTKVSYAN